MLPNPLVRTTSFEKITVATADIIALRAGASANRPSAAQANEHINFSELRALVVDDSPSMRGAMRLTLSNFGVTKVQVSANAAEAIFQIKNRPYDVVLCDFNLGDGRDGQLLLEELRYGNLISLDTVFMMVTAESNYESVAATAELAPDDYVIKPFSAEVLSHRLETVLQKKRAFKDVYRHFHASELAASAAACDELIRSKPKYVVDALRFKGELLVTMGRFDEAEVLYKEVIKMRAIPWARLGLARALYLQNKHDPAEEELKDVIEAAPGMVAAYDLLSDVCMAKKDTKAAQAALERGVAISGRTVRRQQKLGEVAYDNGDLDTARSAYTKAVEKGRHSMFITPSDYGNLCRVQVEQGDMKAATNTLKYNKGTLRASSEGKLVMAVTQGMVHSKSGDLSGAVKSLDEAGELRASGARGDARTMLDMAGVCMASGRNEEADGLVSEVAKNAHDSDALLSKAKKIYEEAGRADIGTSVLASATSDVRKLNNEGVLLAQQNNYQAAVEKLLKACQEAPNNTRVLMNAVWVILKYIDDAGMNESLLESAIRYLADTERMTPDHSRLPGLRAHLRDVKNRFGMQG